MALTLTTYGGAESVTGSNFLVEGGKGKVLVDCGVMQGKDYVERDAYAPFPYDVPSIDALVITHAHLDHVGAAPKLIREGFRGRAYMTPPTRDLAELILRDSADILRNEASRHGVPPLFTLEDVEAFLERITVLQYHEEREIAPGISLMLRTTGHILGSASVRLRDTEDGASLAITSDIGASPTPLLPDAEAIPDADVVLIESVYGNRSNTEKAHRVDLLKETLQRAAKRGGAIMIPAFSIERTQLMLYELGNLFEKNLLPRIPVFLDSPLAISVTEVYRKWGKEYLKSSAQEEMEHDGDLFDFPYLTQTRAREDSEAIAETPNPKIIMAGAGMSHGGRISRHEARYLPDPKSTLIMVGYQAPGSPGRMLQSGAPKVFLDGREVRVRAKVETMHGWSGHADQDGLLNFARSCTPRTKTFLVGIGEPASARFLAQRINHFLGVKAVAPRTGESFHITKAGVASREYRA
jgi:metallo-beta-lactamase family protein